MGYYSSFEIEIKKQPADTVVDIAELIFFLEDEHDLEGCLYKDGECAFSGHEMKWYNACTHLQEFVSKFPGLVLMCLRKGEDAGDCEKTFYQANKPIISQRMVWPAEPDFK